MTPSAKRSGGRSVDVQDRPSAGTGHRPKLRRTLSSRAPRRVSGPARSGPRDAPSGGRPEDARARPTSPRSPRSTSRSSHRIGARAAAFVRTLPDHPLLDRIVRGRAWIPLLGVMLAGIVATQVEVLKLGASVGRSVERSTQLETANEQLRANVATLADDQRIERLAAGMGMVMPAPDAVSFLSIRGSGDVGRAIANIHAPSPASFLSLLPAGGTTLTPGGQSITPTGGAVTPAAGASGSTASTATATGAGAPATTAAAAGAPATTAAAAGATPASSSESSQTSGG